MDQTSSLSTGSNGNIEAQVATACAETITIVHNAIRTVQTAALDVQDAVVALQRLHERLQAEGLQADTGQALRKALAHGQALVQTFDAIGMYDPVPIELL